MYVSVTSSNQQLVYIVAQVQVDIPALMIIRFKRDENLIQTQY